MFWFIYRYKLQREASHFGVAGHIWRCVPLSRVKMALYVGNEHYFRSEIAK